MRLIRWSVGHLPVLACCYLLVVVAAGMALLRGIPLRLAPAIEAPLLAVTTEVMGLSPEQIEVRVTNPLERRLAACGGVRYVRSTSMRGMSIITLEYPYHTDMARASREASAAVAEVAPSLELAGRNHRGPALRTVDPLDIPVLRLAVRAPAWGHEALRSYLEHAVRPRLALLPGVRDVWTFGAASPPLVVMVDPGALRARGVLLDALHATLRAACLQQGSGTLVDALGRETWVLPAGVPRDAAEVAALRVPTSRGGSVRVAEVADVRRQGARDLPRYRCNGVPAIEVCITQQAEASSPQVIAAVRTALTELERLAPGLEIEEAYDNAHFVERVGHNVWIELGVAVVLTGLVVWLFLGEARGTLIALATVPTSLACALLGFAPLGLSLNASTLVGLLLAIGRLVDDTIIDLHAVGRHRALGKDARSAAVDGCSEVRRVVIGATVVVCLAMLPLTRTGGLTQDMFVGIVWPFLLALAASLVVALTLTPALAAWAYDGVPAPAGPPPLERLLQRVEAGYRGLLVVALRHRALVLSAALGSCYLAAVLVPLVGSEMMPLSDTGQLYAVMEARPGTSLDETARLAGQLEELLLRRPEVLRVSTEIGGADEGTSVSGYARSGTSSATLWITLRDKDERVATIWDVADSVWDQAMQQMPGLRRLSLKEMGSDVMASSMAPVELLIHGPDLPRLAWLAEETCQLAATASSQGRPLLDRDQGLRQVSTSWGLHQPALVVAPDAERCARAGWTAAALWDAVQLATEGAQPGHLADGTPLMLMLDEASRRDAPTLAKLSLGRPAGVAPDLGLERVPLPHDARARGPVELGRLAHLKRGEVVPDMIEHDGLRRCISVMGSYRNGGPGSMQLGMDLLMAARMQVGLPPGYDIEQRGDMVAMMDAFERLLSGLGVALLLVYGALAVQLRSLVLPLVVMASIPLELPGVMLALVLGHQTFSTVSLLGMVVLNGMDVTAAILVIDAALQQVGRVRTGQLAPTEAIAGAAASRLRPVLMTVLVTLVVMVPLAFFPRTGMDAYTPLAVVVAGGLVTSTLLTLGAVPVLLHVLGPWGRVANDPAPADELPMEARIGA